MKRMTPIRRNLRLYGNKNKGTRGDVIAAAKRKARRKMSGLRVVLKEQQQGWLTVKQQTLWTTEREKDDPYPACRPTKSACTKLKAKFKRIAGKERKVAKGPSKQLRKSGCGHMNKAGKAPIKKPKSE